MNQTAGSAVFVKTIGLSPLKTRLAKTKGESWAHEFYRRSCLGVESVLQSVDGLASYWAVAEGEKAFASWSGLSTMEQGSGELGSRLDFVYKRLLSQYQMGILLGADAPQVSKNLFTKAIEWGRDGSFVMGPAKDGGFYLLLGSQDVSASIWESVPYSAINTCESLAKNLESIAPVKYLPELGDVDYEEDLEQLVSDLSSLDSPTAEQISLLNWLQN